MIERLAYMDKRTDLDKCSHQEHGLCPECLKRLESLKCPEPKHVPIYTLSEALVEASTFFTKLTLWVEDCYVWEIAVSETVIRRRARIPYGYPGLVDRTPEEQWIGCDCGDAYYELPKNGMLSNGVSMLHIKYIGR
jgi:hypothetical protein